MAETTDDIRKMTVEQVMTPEPIVVPPSATVQEMAELMDANEISGVPVVDVQGRLLGVVSKTDLLHRCLEGPPGNRDDEVLFWDLLRSASRFSGESSPDALGVAEDFMALEPATAKPGDLVGNAAHRMAEDRIHRIIVVDDDNHVLGIVTSLDILKVFPV